MIWDRRWFYCLITAGRTAIGVRAERGSTSLSIAGDYIAWEVCSEGLDAETKVRQDNQITSSLSPYRKVR